MMAPIPAAMAERLGAMDALALARLIRRHRALSASCLMARVLCVIAMGAARLALPCLGAVALLAAALCAAFEPGLPEACAWIASGALAAWLCVFLALLLHGAAWRARDWAERRQSWLSDVACEARWALGERPGEARALRERSALGRSVGSVKTKRGASRASRL